MPIVLENNEPIVRVPPSGQTQLGNPECYTHFAMWNAHILGISLLDLPGHFSKSQTQSERPLHRNKWVGNFDSTTLVLSGNSTWLCELLNVQ